MQAFNGLKIVILHQREMDFGVVNFSFQRMRMTRDFRRCDDQLLWCTAVFSRALIKSAFCTGRASNRRSVANRSDTCGEKVRVREWRGKEI